MSELAWGNPKRNNMILDALKPEERKALFALSRPCHFPAQQLIFAKGDAGDALLFIDSGRVEISLTTIAGDKSIIAYLGAGDCLGEMAVLMGSNRTADSYSTTDVTGQMIQRAKLNSFLVQHPEATLGLVSDLCHKLERTTGNLADHVVSTGTTRLAKVICDLYSRWGRADADGNYRLSPGVSQSDLGEMSGLTRESVNRQIKAWEKDGIVKREGRALIVCDPVQMTELSGETVD